MSNLKLAIVVEAIDQFSSTFGRMGSAVQSRLSQMRQNVGGFADALERVGSRAAGIAASVGAGFEARRVIDELDMFNRIGIDAGLSAERMEQFKARLFSVAGESRVPLDQLTSAFHEMFALAPFQEADRALGAMAMTIQRLGGDSGSAVGELFGALEKISKLRGPDDLIRSMAILREQVGPHTEWLSDFARIAPDLLAQYGSQGITGIRQVRDIGALYATIRPYMLRSTTAATDIQQILDAVADPMRAQRLQGIGVHVLGRTQQEANANFLTHQRRPLSEYMPELMKAYQTPALSFTLDQILGAQVRDVLARANSRDLLAALRAPGDRKKIEDETKRAASSTAAALNALYTAIDDMSDRFLAGPLQGVADVLTAFPRLTAQGIMALGGLAIAGAAAGWIRNLREAFGGAGGEALRTAAAVREVTAAVTAESAAEAARSRAAGAAGAMARGVGIRGFFLADLLWNAKDTVDRYAADEKAARERMSPAEFEAWKKARAARTQQSFGEALVGWLPGFNHSWGFGYDPNGTGIDWTKQLPWTGLGPRLWNSLTGGSGSEKPPLETNTNISIRLENVPSGMRARTRRVDSDANGDVKVETGYGMLAP